MAYANLQEATATRAGAQQPRILVVEDEPRIALFIQRALVQAGYRVDMVADGVSALAAAEAAPPDLVLLDVMLPGLDGMEVARRLRGKGGIPILMLTARDAVTDRVEGLDAGADDYLVKPFALEELLARVRALLRRIAPNGDGEGGRLRFGDLALDPPAHAAWRGERKIELTRTEFNLLQQFMLHPGRVLTRDFI